MSVYADSDGKLHLDVAPTEDEGRFTVKNSLLILRLWRESVGIVRCSLHHPASGSTAYLQGNDELATLSEHIELELHR